VTRDGGVRDAVVDDLVTVQEPGRIGLADRAVGDADDELLVGHDVAAGAGTNAGASIEGISSFGRPRTTGSPSITACSIHWRPCESASASGTASSSESTRDIDRSCQRLTTLSPAAGGG
jgi:hypothetical protein